MNKSELLLPILYITKKNQYILNVEKKIIKFFKYRIEIDNKNLEMREIYCDIKKNPVFILKQLASLLCIKEYSKKKKPELIKELKDRIMFE